MKVKAIILAAALLLFAAEAGAEGFYVLGGVGESRFQITTEDGTWIQQGNGNHVRKEAFAWKAGLGYRWDHWALEAAYINFGKTYVQGYWSPDETYDGKAHKCLAKCDQGYYAQVSDAMEGIELVPLYRVKVKEFEPFIGLGLFGAKHRIQIWGSEPFSGYIVGAAMRGGVCWHVVCAEATWYRGVVETQHSYPISTSVFMPMLTLRKEF